MTVHLYGVMWAQQVPDVLPPGLEEAPVGSLREGGLAALFTEHERPPELDMAAAQQHGRVVDAAARDRAVLPARLNAMVEGEPALRGLLEARGPAFRRDLEDVEGKVEVVVHAEDGTVPAEIAALSCARATADGPAAYLVRRSALEAFLAAAARMDHPGHRLLVTGPWPPYSFVGGAGEALTAERRTA